ncbi:MAG TPA: DUF3617 family protein [Casimicrobiaceae bacterium]|nr:DUF3617 family protein [Casimicrobiaceae bacterium]
MFVAIGLRLRTMFATAAAAAMLGLPAPGIAQGSDQLWEVTVKMEMPGMPMAMAPQVHRVCIAQNHRDEDLIPVQGNCRVLESKRVGNRMTYAMACTGEQAMNATGEITMAADRYDGRMQMTMSQGGQPMEMTQTYAGRRVGGCTATK